MSEPARASERMGPGRLILVVGPSGAGKDTLIDLTRAACRDDASLVFAQRVVTRQASAAENNIQVSADTFAAACATGDYAIWWEAHGLQYALPSTINDDLVEGRSVVANVSRAVVRSLRSLYADVVVVEITAPAEMLAQRLAARGRVSDGPVAQRLGRAAAVVAADVTIDNVGDAKLNALKLIDVVRQTTASNKASSG